MSRPAANRAIFGLAMAVIPGLIVNLGVARRSKGPCRRTFSGCLSVELQSPQHMLPHLWRMPQWLAWCCYLVLAGTRPGRPVPTKGNASESGFGRYQLVHRPRPAARLRLAVVLCVILAGLGVAWYAIEVRHQVRITVFQPFRMATVVRGIALVFIAGRLVALWRDGGWLGRMRAIMIAAAFTGDWLLVVVTLAELAVSVVEVIRSLVALGRTLAVRRSCGARGAAGIRPEFPGTPRHGVRKPNVPGGARCRSAGRLRYARWRGSDRSMATEDAGPVAIPYAVVPAGPLWDCFHAGGRHGWSRWRRCWRRQCRSIMPRRVILWCAG